jgi:hypothetical protein
VTSIVTGATPERFEIVKWFYIEADDDTDYDAAADVIARAMTYLDRSTPVAELDGQPPAALVRPGHRTGALLRDLDAVLGNERVPAADPAAEPGRRAPPSPDQVRRSTSCSICTSSWPPRSRHDPRTSDTRTSTSGRSSVG